MAAIAVVAAVAAHATACTASAAGDASLRLKRSVRGHSIVVRAAGTTPLPSSVLVVQVQPRTQPCSDRSRRARARLSTSGRFTQRFRFRAAPSLARTAACGWLIAQTRSGGKVLARARSGGRPEQEGFKPSIPAAVWWALLLFVTVVVLRRRSRRQRLLNALGRMARRARRHPTPSEQPIAPIESVTPSALVLTPAAPSPDKPVIAAPTVSHSASVDELRRRRRRGDHAEGKVRAILDDMENDGWWVGHNLIPEDGSRSDVDHYVKRNDRRYVIETKSARGLRPKMLYQTARNARRIARLEDLPPESVGAVLCLVWRQVPPETRRVDGSTVTILGPDDLRDHLEHAET